MSESHRINNEEKQSPVEVLLSNDHLGGNNKQSHPKLERIAGLLAKGGAAIRALAGRVSVDEQLTEDN